MSSELSNKNYKMIDVMKFVAAVLVICIHTSPINGEIGYFLNNILARIAVPFFFLTSGYFLYSKVEKDYKYIYKYIKKIFYLYSSWYIIYLIFRLLMGIMNGLSIKSIIVLLREFLFSGYYHLWYLPSLILSIFIVSIFIKKRQYYFLYITSILLFSFGILGDSYYGVFENNLLTKLLDIYFFIFGTTKAGICFGIPFITLGVIIRKYDIKFNHLNLMLILSGILFIAESTILEFYNIGKGRNIYIMLTFITPLVFIKLLHLRYDISPGTAKLLRQLSLSIYCSHVIFILIFNKLIERIQYEGPYINLFKFFFVCILSFLFSFLLEIIKELYFTNNSTSEHDHKRDFIMKSLFLGKGKE